MTLIIRLTSSKNGPVIGLTEDNQEIILAVPHSRAVSGLNARKNKAKAEKRLLQLARDDSGNYYNIGGIEISPDSKTFAIPYTLFMR